MTRFLLQVAVLLSAVGPVAGFAQSDNEPPLYIINFFEIYGSVEVSTEDYKGTPYLVQSENMVESLNWLLGKSELIRLLHLTSNHQVIERSEAPTPLGSIKRESFEIKRLARTDRVSAEIYVSTTLEANKAGITIKGLQSITLSPIGDDDSYSRANLSVSFGVKVGKEGPVRICGCDVFDKSFFQDQPGFQDDGENCSFQVREQYAGQFKAKPSSLLAELIESMPQEVRDSLAPKTPGYPLTFSAELEAEANGRSGKNTEGVGLAKPFKITIGKESEECSRKIVNAAPELYWSGGIKGNLADHPSKYHTLNNFGNTTLRYTLRIKNQGRCLLNLGTQYDYRKTTGLQREWTALTAQRGETQEVTNILPAHSSLHLRLFGERDHTEKMDQWCEGTAESMLQK